MAWHRRAFHLLTVLVALAAGCDRARPVAGEDVPACQRCHGGEGSAAPPRSTRGATATTDRGVGAHRQHLSGGALRGPIDCQDCHLVPAGIDDHIDGRPHATVTFPPGRLARAGGASPAWEPDAAGGPSCAGVYCHGATLGAGGAATAPIWTQVDGTQKGCGACHGAPPSSPRHPQPPVGADCHACHPDTVRADGTIDVAGGRHIDGRVDVAALACTACHGDPARAVAPAAPPLGTRGETATTSRAVGAHQRHLAGGTVAGPTPCDACHLVPSDLSHVDGAATVSFGALSRRGGAAPEWRPDDLAGPTCGGTYCHGATLGAGGAATAPIWTRADGSQLACGSCHGAPPSNASHPQGPAAARCSACHPDTVRPDGTIDLAGGRHIDGRIDVAAGGGCGACHGAPPASGTHLLHARLPAGVEAAYGAVTVLEDVAPAGGPDYAFGCGQCHPLDPARHMDGQLEVELGPAGAPAGSLKARSAAGAAYDPAAGTCSGTYCHSSGQEAPAFVASPAWTAAPGGLGCRGCHANPPAYPSSGPGAAGANGHLQLQADGYEWGHFAGLPGPWHPGGSKHGGAWPGDDAAPITCQTCHFDTVDPAAAGPSGLYWLDTTGRYQLPGGLLGFDCLACHGVAGGPPTGRGRVLPLRHVNGRREVVFDPRTSLPEMAWLPAAPNRPTRPYWVTNAATMVTLPAPSIPDAVMDGATLSLHLGSARYDPASKTCASVACHLAQTTVTWGAAYATFASCAACHGL